MALPTTLDNLNATMYALDRIKKERCISKVPSTPGLEYQAEDNKRMYPCPKGLKGCEHGRCVITTEELCKSKSMTPFDSKGNELIGVPCSEKDPKCPSGQVCGKNKKCYDKKPYLEFHDGKCVYGNFALRRWCQFPSARGESGRHPDTGVPYNPFDYDERTGKCSITREYCEQDMKTSYKVDEQGRPTCYSRTGEKVGTFFLGRTVFRGIKGAFSGDYYKGGVHDHPMVQLYKNFGGEGVSLYLKDGKIGFKEDEIKKRYPEVFNDKGGISFTLEELRKDQGKKRIYFIEKNSYWLSGPILKAIVKRGL